MLCQDKKAYTLNQKKNVKKLFYVKNIVGKHSLLEGEKEIAMNVHSLPFLYGQKTP